MLTIVTSNIKSWRIAKNTTKLPKQSSLYWSSRMIVRVGETDQNWFRSERYIHVNDQWFFTTREMTEEGPFISKQEAEMELMLYIRYSNDALLKQRA